MPTSTPTTPGHVASIPPTTCSPPTLGHSSTPTGSSTSTRSDRARSSPARAPATASTTCLQLDACAEPPPLRPPGSDPHRRDVVRPPSGADDELMDPGQLRHEVG